MDPTKKELQYTTRHWGAVHSKADLKSYHMWFRLAPNDAATEVRSKSQLAARPDNFKLVDDTAVLHLVVDVSNHLTGDDINYGTVRCSEVVVDEQLKFVHVYFVEQGVSAMKKGRASMSKQAIGGSVRRMASSHSPLVWLNILTTLWSKRSNLSRRASIQLPSGRTASLCPHTAVFIHPAIRYQHMHCNYSFQICMFITCMYLKPYLLAVWSTFIISADHQSEYNCGRKRVSWALGGRCAADAPVAFQWRSRWQRSSTTGFVQQKQSILVKFTWPSNQSTKCQV